MLIRIEQMKNILLILGNGFTIDFLQKYSEWKGHDLKIDVRNLFKYGESVITPWDKKPGFLSYKNCPYLWTLGARPTLSCSESNALIEEVISCANMFFDFTKDELYREKRVNMLNGDISIYMKAYKELLTYLGYLFNNYNSYISDKELKDFVMECNNWGWLDVFKKLNNDTFINIITYNYDIWLERILKACNIEYSIGCLENKKTKIIIYKPHGSISFYDKDNKEESYGINYQLNANELEINKISIDEVIVKKSNRSIIIPPAGESERLQFVAPWASSIKAKAINAIKMMNKQEETLIVMCGISYWHVDRREIDQLLININENAEFILINPTPPRDLNAVLSSIFKKYILQLSADNLGVILNG